MCKHFENWSEKLTTALLKVMSHITLFQIWGSVCSVLAVPRRKLHCKNFDLSKWYILLNQTSELLPSRHIRLTIINFDNAESQIVKMTNLGSFYEKCLHLFDRNFSTFSLMFQLRLTSPHGWQVRGEIFEAVRTSCWLRLAVLRAIIFFTCKVFWDAVLFTFALFTE